MTMPETIFDWAIAQLEHRTEDGIVFTVHYTVSANDGTYTAGAYGSIDLEQPEDDIIPFAELTEELVIGWVKDRLSSEEKITGVEAALQVQLDEQHAPSKAIGKPWAG